jgi:hypothetical protein
MRSQSADSGVSYTVTSVGVESRSRCYGVTSEVVTMSLAARCKCRSRIPRRGAPPSLASARIAPLRFASRRSAFSCILLRSNGDFGSKRLGSNARLLGRKAKHFMLAGPFRRQVGEARNRHALRESPFNGGSDEVRCKERKRDRHIDFAHATPRLQCCRG